MWTSYKLESFNYFINPLFYLILSYFPQHCLYFFPEPQVEANPVYIVFMLFAILLLFQYFVDSVTSVFAEFIVLLLL